ncbi:MAG: phosphoribosylformylglycinamidine synthase, partial [Eggerthellaceae bacterium]|nr:phosphoribosylformylglycinamidine synthase [Eggerthellaceae bacterium]
NLDEALAGGEAPAALFAIEYQPGQFDQRADSAAQCIQIISQGERPLVKNAHVYALFGDISAEDIAAIKRYLINPVDSREASLELPETLDMAWDEPAPVERLAGFNELDEAGRTALIKQLGLAMDTADMAMCQEYFAGEGREPSLTEIRMIDTYWSDHCRHTTFNTRIDDITIDDPQIAAAYEDYLAGRAEIGRTKPVCLMDMGTLAAKVLKSRGHLAGLDESEEINACTVKVDVDVDGVEKPWLLLFKHETHNHPTEIEPFGGAATCIGGCIRDPLSGRAYVHGAMRLTGAADPTAPVEATIPGKLPQRKIVTEAAHGYSSYGNQIGLATGIVDEVYHPGYAAKRMEVGAVIAAAPAENVRREVPAPGDAVILLGGGTGRDGIGGATGSSKAHDSHSVETCGSEVQKGNAPEERKIQRLFRNGNATRLIKRCNDFGAGGVSVAIGELADGVDINLNAVPKKYEGLDGTELAISESQERMAVVVADADVPAFMALAAAENLNAVVVARVTDDARVHMTWNGDVIVDISREFLNSNGAEKHTTVHIEAPELTQPVFEGTFAENAKATLGGLAACSRRGLSERFDSAIGAATVLMPFGGVHQRTPIQAMVHRFPVLGATTQTCSMMSWGFDPDRSVESPFHGAYMSVVDSVAKLAATGADVSHGGVYASFQEYFRKLGTSPENWGKTAAALLGAYKAQLDLGVAAIGGKDSMSGSFEDIHVPPTLISFAVTATKAEEIRTPELKAAGHTLAVVAPDMKDGLPEAGSLRKVLADVHGALADGRAVGAYALGAMSPFEAAYKMAIGNGFGVAFAGESPSVCAHLFAGCPAGFVLELGDGVSVADVPGAEVLGEVIDKAVFTFAGESVPLPDLDAGYEGKLEDVFPMGAAPADVAEARDAEIHPIEPGPKGMAFMPPLEKMPENFAAPLIRVAKPKVLIPVFPGTNCEWDSARAVEAASAEAEIFVVRNLDAAAIADSVADFARRLETAQAVFIPGGFSGGDEPDGSGKFITAFFRNDEVRRGVDALLDE